MVTHNSDLMIGSASVEDTLALRPSSCEMPSSASVHSLRRSGSRPRRGILDGLLGNEPRKTGWMQRKRPAIQARGASRRSWAGQWDADALREHCPCVRAGNARRRGRIDETGFLDRGQSIVRGHTLVHRLGGHDHHFPIGVFASYVSRHGDAFIDRALRLPKESTGPRRSPEGSGMTERSGLCDEAQISRRMIARVIAAMPFSFAAKLKLQL